MIQQPDAGKNLQFMPEEHSRVIFVEYAPALPWIVIGALLLGGAVWWGLRRWHGRG